MAFCLRSTGKSRQGQAKLSLKQISIEEDYKRLLYMLDNEDNQLPLVVSTHARPGEKKPVKSMSMEELIKSDQMKSFLPLFGTQVPDAISKTERKYDLLMEEQERM